MFIKPVKYRLDRFLSKYFFKQIYSRQYDILASHYLTPLSTFYLPWSEPSIRPSGLVKILNDILVNNHLNVVECGSGISTFYLASLLKRLGGHIYTVEHDEKWLDFIRVNLQKEGLDEVVTTIHAPLKPTKLAIDNTDWYDTDILDKEFSSQTNIELLVVDGPPAFLEKIQYSRYPALPYFASKLASDFTIILDDIARPAEQKIVEKWSKILDITFDNHEIEGGVSVGTSKSSYSI